MPKSETQNGYVYYDGELLGIKRPVFVLNNVRDIRYISFTDDKMIYITDSGDFEEAPHVSGITAAFIEATGLTGRNSQSGIIVTSLDRDEFVYKAIPV